MAQVFAGFVSGYLLALLTTPLLALLLLRLRAGNELLMRLLPRDANVAAVALLLHGGLTIALTGLGLVLGLILLAMEDAGSGAGSRNWAFTLFVAAMALSAFAPIYAFLWRFRSLVVGYALLSVAIFGWLMPYLADWSKF